LHWKVEKPEVHNLILTHTNNYWDKLTWTKAIKAIALHRITYKIPDMRNNPPVALLVYLLSKSYKETNAAIKSSSFEFSNLAILIIVVSTHIQLLAQQELSQ
jgi:hypothetical protein